MARRFSAVLLTTLVVLAGCGEPDRTVSGGPEILLLRSGAALAVVQDGADTPSFRAPAVPSADWSTVVREILVNGRTRVVALNPYTGDQRWDQIIEGSFRVKLVSNDGDRVALGSIRERSHTAGRAHTKLVVSGRDMNSARVIELDGNYEPEAFSTDGRSLFVIKYLPARAPTKYQVRRLDIENGRVHGVYTPDAHLQRAMGGTARIQASSPDGRRLYTLYTTGGAAGRRYAFIHVLSLDELWAHCINLPEEFSEGAQSATTITTSSDGARLFVVNGGSGAVAVIDTETFAVQRSATIDLGSERGTTHAVADKSGTLYVARGKHVSVVDLDSLAERASWDMPEKVRGLQVASDNSALYVGLPRQVEVVDTTSWDTIRSIDPPGVRRLKQLGPVMRPAAADENLTCAC